MSLRVSWPQSIVNSSHVQSYERILLHTMEQNRQKREKRGEGTIKSNIFLKKKMCCDLEGAIGHKPPNGDGDLSLLRKWYGNEGGKERAICEEGGMWKTQKRRGYVN